MPGKNVEGSSLKKIITDISHYAQDMLSIFDLTKTL